MTADTPIITNFKRREPARGERAVFSFRLPEDRRKSTLGHRKRDTPLLPHGERAQGMLEDCAMQRSVNVDLRGYSPAGGEKRNCS